MSRARLLASGTFVVAYLTFQIVYPALSWFRPGLDRFTWHMYAGQEETPRFLVHFADGSTRDAGVLLRRNNPVRLFGPSVDQERFVPPHLCGLWTGAREVQVRYVHAGRDVIIKCP
ncbi:MAG: hypothetical protein ABL986_08915 [Vicinamibacterales bacterium]